VPNAELLVRHSSLAFANGDIGYIEYLFAIGESTRVMESYTSALRSYVQSVITIELFSETVN
jgi:cobalt-zinc-cadmium resistance protein CzcA